MKMGRTIYDNLRKAIIFMLPTNGGQGLVIFVALLIGMTLPITPLQVLWVNLITAVTLSLSMAFEPSEPGIMERRPRDPRAGVLDAEAIIRVTYTSVLLGGSTILVFVLAQNADWSLEASRTVAVNTLVMGQVFYLFAARFSRVSALRRELFTSNPLSWLLILAMMVLQIGFGYLPFMHAAFDTVAVPLSSWLVPVLAGVVIFVAVEIEKAIRRWREN